MIFGVWMLCRNVREKLLLISIKRKFYLMKIGSVVFNKSKILLIHPQWERPLHMPLHTQTHLLDIRKSTLRVLEEVARKLKLELLLIKCWQWEKDNYRALHQWRQIISNVLAAHKCLVSCFISTKLIFHSVRGKQTHIHKGYLWKDIMLQ